jgi:hypothetical protein
VIRQFVAMPLGAGYSAEEQLTGAADHGGLQIEVHPLQAKHYRGPRPLAEYRSDITPSAACMCCESPGMALAPGGRMEQEIAKDRNRLSHYALDHRSRCFVHLCNSLVWREITGMCPPTTPLTATEYARAGLPWFDYYSEEPAVDGSAKLAGLQSVAALGQAKGALPLPGNQPVEPKPLITIHKKHPDVVREAEF